MKIEKIENDSTLHFKKILKGSIIAFILTIIGLFIYAVLLTYTNINTENINTIIIAIASVSILISTIMVLKKIKNKGIVNGALIGIAYMFLLYLTSSIITSNFSLTLLSGTMILLGCISGMIGGIVAVNIR